MYPAVHPKREPTRYLDDTNLYQFLAILSDEKILSSLDYSEQDFYSDGLCIQPVSFDILFIF